MSCNYSKTHQGHVGRVVWTAGCSLVSARSCSTLLVALGLLSAPGRAQANAGAAPEPEASTPPAAEATVSVQASPASAPEPAAIVQPRVAAPEEVPAAVAPPPHQPAISSGDEAEADGEKNRRRSAKSRRGGKGKGARKGLRARIAAKARPVVGLAPKWRLDFAVGGGQSFIYDDTFRYFNDYGDVDAGQWWSRINLGFAIGDEGRVSLGPALGWERSSSHSYGYELDANWGGEYYDSASLQFDDLSLGLRANLVLVEGIDFFADLRGGLVLGQAWLPFSPPVRVENHDFVRGMGSLGLGFSLYLPRRWLPRKGAAHVDVGIDIEAVYKVRGNVDFRYLRVERDEDELREPGASATEIPTQLPELGTLQPSALSWRTGLFIRFM